MTKQEEIAQCMYEVNRIFLSNKNVDLPDWSVLSDAHKTYWIALADAAIECMQEVDEAMVKAALQAYQRPYPVDDTIDTWDKIRTREFLRIHNAAMEATKIDWTKRLKK